MARIRIVVEDQLAQRQSEKALAGEPITIGREASCELTLQSPYISRRHARILPSGDGYVIETHGLNQTCLNRKLLRPGEQQSITPGDVVTLPGFTLRLSDGDQRRYRWRTVERMRRFSDLKASLHKQLLERVDLRRLSGSELREKQRRAEIRTALQQLLDGDLPIDAELAELILGEAVAAALVDRLLARSTSSATGARWNIDPEERSFNELVVRCARELGLEQGGLELRERLQAIHQRIEDVLAAQRTAITPSLERFIVRRTLRRDLEALIFGLGPLEDLLRLPDLNEIMVIGRDKIFVEMAGRLEETGRSFPTDDDLEVVIGRLMAPAGRFVNRSQPIVDARFADGSRINVVIPPVSIRGPSITVRKFRAEPFSIEDLVELGTLNQRAVSFLRGSVLGRRNLIVVGGTGSGKTTLLNTLSTQIPTDERLVVIEDAAELQLPQPNQVVLEARRANIEGEGEIPIRALVKSALRMRPDRIIVGECRGAEALDMLQAMNTGHDGSLTTAHASSPGELVARLEVMVLEAGQNLPLSAIHRQIAGALDIAVQIERQRDRVRRVTHITEIVAYDPEEERVVLEDIFRLTAAADRPPELRFTGYLPTFIEDLLDRGDLRLEELF